jgi:hypothetical protein
MPKKKTKKKKTNGSVGGKADVHAHEEGKRNKSLLGHNAIFTPEVIDDIHIKVSTRKIQNARNGIDEKNSNI